MADTVQRLLEQMIPELEDLEKRCLFTRAEIKQIVKKRTEFEYRLKRRATLKDDYLQYVKYEQNVEVLRKLRKKAIVRKLEASSLHWRPSLCDRAISRRIMFIYERAVRKFKGDLRLWLSYMEYCRGRNTTRKMQKVMTKALQLHPLVPGLWMYSAAWEFEENANVAAARALMQRGLRMCPKAESLWAEYFRMELTYAQKLKARRMVLGLQATKSEDHAPVEMEGGTALEKEKELLDKDKLFLEGNGERDQVTVRNEPAPEDELSVKIARAIYRNAIAAVPRSPGFRRRFLDMMCKVDFEGAHLVEEDVYASLARDFPCDPESCSILAHRPVVEQRRGRGAGGKLTREKAHRQAVQVFEEALEKAPVARMYELYAQYLETVFAGDQLADTAAQDDNAESSKHLSSGDDLRDSAARELRSLYERASRHDLQAANLQHRHLAFLLQQGHPHAALQLARELSGREGLASSADTWIVRCCLELLESESGVQMATFLEALEKVSVAAASPLWMMFLQRAGCGEVAVQKVVEVAVRSLASSGSNNQATGDVGCAIVSWAEQTAGLEAARRAYDRLLALPGRTLGLLQHCAAMESRAAAVGDELALPRMRKLLEGAVAVHGDNNPSVWLEFCRLEHLVGSVEAANNVFWRAKKALKNVSSFLEDHQTLLTQMQD